MEIIYNCASFYSSSPLTAVVVKDPPHIVSHTLSHSYSTIHLTTFRITASLSDRLLVEALSVLSAPLASSLRLDVGETLAAGIGVNILDVLERDGRNKAL